MFSFLFCMNAVVYACVESKLIDLFKLHNSNKVKFNFKKRKMYWNTDNTCVSQKEDANLAFHVSFCIVKINLNVVFTYILYVSVNRYSNPTWSVNNKPLIFQWTGLPCSGRQVRRSSGSTPTCVRTWDCCGCSPALQLRLYVAYVYNSYVRSNIDEIDGKVIMHNHLHTYFISRSKHSFNPQCRELS